MTRTTAIVLTLVALGLVGSTAYFVTRPEDTVETTQTTSQTTTTPEQTTPVPDAALDTVDLPVSEPLIEDTQTISTDIALQSAAERVEYNLPRAKTGTISVSATVDSDGLIEDLSYTHQDVDSSSTPHHNAFDNGIDLQEFIGQSLDEVDDVFISGASLTSGGFNQALEGLRGAL